MSWEAWGTPPDKEPERCPVCGESSHLEGCELGAEQARRVKAEAAVERVRGVLRELVEANEAFAAASMSAEVAQENYSNATREVNAMAKAMFRASAAEKAARAELGSKG